MNPKRLKPSLKIVALYLQMTKNINLTDIMRDALYRFKVLTIEEFLSPNVIGREKAAYYAPETAWGKVLRDFFRPESTFFEIVAAGAIGTGKSVACQTMAIYNLYRVCCLRHPQAFLGSDVTKYLTWQIITPSLKTSQRLALEPIVECLRLYDLFEEVRTERDLNFYVGNKIAWRKTPDGVDFENRIRITGGSRVQHALGQEVFSVLSDEADFSLSADKTQSFFLYSKLLKRITSRFKNGLYNAKYLFAAIISSTTHEKGVINTYAKEIQNSKRNVSTKVISFRQWDIKGGLNPFGIDGKQYFYCLRGNLMNPSKVFDDGEKLLIDSGTYKTPGGCSLIKVPLRYYDDFTNHLETALQDLAGEATLLNECPIQTLDGCVDNVLCSLITVNASINSEISISEEKSKWEEIRTRKDSTSGEREHTGSTTMTKEDVAICEQLQQRIFKRR
jgi:hypothetical protein